MSTAPQANEPELVTGTITGVVAKGGDKWQAIVQPDGSQYTKNLWTKDANLAGQLAQMVGQRQSFLCGSSHWTNAQGQPVRSLWINGVGPQAEQRGVDPTPTQQIAQPQQFQQQPQVLPQPLAQQQTGQYIQQAMHQPQAVTTAGPQTTMMPGTPSPTEKEERIMREAAAKVAGLLISHLPVEQRTMDNVIRLSEQLVAYFRNGVDWKQGPQPATHESVSGTGPMYEGQPLPPQGDDPDDIPF